MAIKSIEIKNFTVFHNMKCDFSPGINVFIGENGTGKTHLLKLMFGGNLLHSEERLISMNELFGWSGVRGCTLNVNGNAFPWTDIFVATEPNTLTTVQPETQVNMTMDSKGSTVFIPAKEVLSMSNITRVADEYKSSLSLDATLTNIIEKARRMLPDTHPDFALHVASKLENAIQGKVHYDDKSGTFWMYKNNGKKNTFRCESEGFNKLGLLWQLVMNKSIKEGTILLWDEPEANLNPKLIPVIVDILLELSRNGVQIFLASHDYVFAKYFEVRDEDSGQICFHSLYKSDQWVVCESNANFRDLTNNPIISAFDILMDEVLYKNMGD